MDNEASPTSMDSTSSGDPSRAPGSSSRKRKIRKGTHSCWECKRRKARCIFAAATDDICVSCRRRGLSCIRQDLPEELSTSKSSRPDIDERLDKVENLLSELNSKLRQGSSQFKEKSEEGCPRSSDATIQGGIDIGSTDLEIGARLLHAQPQENNHQAITSALLSTWPSPKDTEALLQHSHGPMLYCHHLLAGHGCRLTEEDYSRKPTKPLFIPGPELHPVVLARRMLFGVLFLQSPCASYRNLFSEPARNIMNRLLPAAVGLVNSNDDLHGSLESVECFMLESMYHMHYGNLRKSWLVNRRAMLLAQMIGMHHRPMPPLQSLDSQLTIDPEAMWSRIVCQDRYLCLLLGLPSGSSITPTPCPNSVPRSYCCTRNQIETSLHVMNGKVLERNEARRLEYNQDLTIDAELLGLANSAPEGFWCAPQLEGIIPGSYADAQAVATLKTQVVYYHSLNQLHWPYLLNTIHCSRGVRSNKHEEYSAMTCVHASREILHRFVLYRSFNPSSQCYRPVDFVAITAVLTLLLAHLDIHYSAFLPDGEGKRADYLAHQRLGDRLLLDQAMEKLETVSRNNLDTTSIKRIEGLRCLVRMKMEASRENHMIHISAAKAAADGMLEAERDADAGEGELEFPAPFFGTVRISQGGTISKTFSQAATVVGSSYDFDPEAVIPSSDSQLSNPSAGISIPNAIGSQYLNISAAAGTDKWAFQGVDTAFFDSLMMGIVPDTDYGISDFSER